MARPKYPEKLNAESHKRITYLLDMRKNRALSAQYPATYRGILKKIKSHTIDVGKALGEESRRNKKLKTFLEQFTFVYIDKHGNLVGTHMPTLIPGLGRKRMRTTKIRNRMHPYGPANKPGTRMKYKHP
ncbi:MAG: hypothetical protein HY393_03980 [Candidatus Diapherotrites archaeon]|nr:hypothetical protein [Candidatus Diapherotrites archaeon]